MTSSTKNAKHVAPAASVIKCTSLLIAVTYTRSRCTNRSTMAVRLTESPTQTRTASWPPKAAKELLTPVLANKPYTEETRREISIYAPGILTTKAVPGGPP